MNFSGRLFFRFLATSFLLSCSVAATERPVKFDSPKKTFHVQVTPGDSGGSDLLPLIAFFTPAAGGRTIQANFQVAGYVAPDAAKVPGLFHFSPDEKTVVIDNPANVSVYGYRITALVPRPWMSGDIDADSVEWADDNRLVFHGQASDGPYIGVFDVRTGRQQKPDPVLSMFTTFELIHVAPTALDFREEDTESHGARCMSWDTVKAKARIIACPDF